MYWDFSNQKIKSFRLSYASLYLAIIGSDNGLSPLWDQAIIWTIAEFLLIAHLVTDIWIKI